MTKLETKKQNLRKLIEDIEKKVEKLEAQKKVYQLSLERLEENSPNQTDDSQ